MESRSGGISKTSVTVAFPLHTTGLQLPADAHTVLTAAVSQERRFEPVIIDPVSAPRDRYGVDVLRETIDRLAADVDAGSPDAMRPNTDVDYFLDQLDRVLDEE